jgi:hypothetical protein
MTKVSIHNYGNMCELLFAPDDLHQLLRSENQHVDAPDYVLGEMLPLLQVFGEQMSKILFIT